MVVDDLIRRAASDLISSKYATALTGAGISTESGIPDSRGPKGIWTTDKEAEAKAYERYELFLRDPQAYWEQLNGELQGDLGVYEKVGLFQRSALGLWCAFSTSSTDASVLQCGEVTRWLA